MLKNLSVNGNYRNIQKVQIHKLVNSLKSDLHFDISSLAINFITANQITEINKKYLNHNFSTDIITFNYSGSNDLLDGELFISIDDAEKNAKRYKILFENEIRRLVIHGILHLAGYDDKELNQKRKMKRIENKLVEKYKEIKQSKL